MPEPASARLGLIAASSGDAIQSWPSQIQAIVARLEAVGAAFQTGLAADRPAVAAANRGHFYVATDTGVVSVSTGSGAWIDLNSATRVALTLTRNDATALTLSGAAAGLTIGGDTTLSRSGDSVLRANGVFEAASGIRSNASVFVDSLGGGNRLYFGSAIDTSLYRSAANTLRTPGALTVDGQLSSGSVATDGVIAQGTAGSHGFSTHVTGDSAYRLHIAHNGIMTWGPGAGVGDLNLYRSAVSVLSTDFTLTAGIDLMAAAYVRSRNGTANAVILGYAGDLGAPAPAIAFGAGWDATLRRWAAGELYTPGILRLGAAALPAAAGVENLRIIRGSVNADGTLNQGGGFTVAQETPGVYRITFAAAFAAIVTATVTPNNSNTGYTAVVDQEAAGSFRVVTRDTTWALTSVRFHFIAAGPR